MVRTHTKIRGNRPRGSIYGCQNLFHFVCITNTNYTTRTFGHFPASILSIFERKDVNRSAHA